MIHSVLSFGIALPSEYETVSALIDGVYAREGYVSHKKGNRSPITSYIGKAGTYTIVARYGDEIIGTVSVVHDGEFGLPMDVIYADELASFRAARMRIGEVCQLVVHATGLTFENYGQHISPTAVSVGLFREVIRYAFKKQYAYLFFTVNPKHRAFYESVGCTQIGQEKSYASVNNAPALAFMLNLSHIAGQHAEEKDNFLLRSIMEGVV